MPLLMVISVEYSISLVISGVIGGLLAAQYGFAGMILGAIISAIVVGIITGVLNWWLKIPSLVLTMGLAMVFEIIGSKLAGHYGFVQIDNKYAIFGSSPNIVMKPLRKTPVSKQIW